jgi:hypothetical protein
MIHDSPHDHFRLILLTVVGQAFGAAGYTLQARPVQWDGGLFQFVKPFDEGETGVIEFQLLAYTDTVFAPVQPSRFRVTLSRGARSRPLSALVVDDFGVAILPSADHWWTFSSTDELGRALAEAGHLAVGYGMPWLSGDLVPPSG